MADYVANSACNGCKPKHLRARHHYQRTALLSRMIQKRDVVRFLIAPSGFGKTALALEYAESIFGFQDVFWLNAQSPCFLRDVDKGTLTASLFAQSRAPSLVVIEDLPRLTESRAESVSACIDRLLERGWEVVVSMVPLYRAFADRQPDGIAICSRDFIVTEDEIQALACEPGIGPQRPLPDSLAGGVPGLLWGGPTATLDMLRSVVAEALPTDSMLGIFVVLSLGHGEFEDAKVFTGPLKSDTRRVLMEDYLFLGLNEHRERFEAYPFPIDEIIRVFSSFLSRMAAESPFPDAGTLVSRLADALLARGDCERACLLVDGCCNADKRIAWLEARTKALSDAACLLPAHRLFESKSMRLNAQTAPVFMAEARRLVGLGDVSTAIRISERIFSLASADKAMRCQASLLMLRCGDADCRRRAAAMLMQLARSLSGKKPQDRINAILGYLDDENRRWAAIALAIIWFSEDSRSAVFVAEACLRRGLVGDAETGIMLWALDTLKGKELSARGPSADVDAERVLAIAGDYLRRCEQGGSFGFEEVVLLEAWDEARSLASPDALYPPLAAARTAAQTLHIRLFAQRSAFEREGGSDRFASNGARRKAGPSKPLGLASADAPGFGGRAVDRGKLVPELHVRLFGGLEASIGGVEVDPTMLRRQKVKTLLAVLVLNQGEEILRERLAAILWPASSPSTAQRNFYSTWSLLRKALSIPGADDPCPYLIWLQYSCKLDTHAVTSDVAEFDQLCNRLLLEPPDVDAWSGVYARLNELYRGDLLPSEGRNEFILRQREEYRSRLIDALVSASTRLFDRGELQSALWFAHAAVRKDSTREDAYTALMQAQIAAGQRTAALDTYFKCKRFLSNELGIDPSPKAVMLYSSIIEAEPNLKGFTPKL